jgi:hypothetical protein
MDSDDITNLKKISSDPGVAFLRINKDSLIWAELTKRGDSIASFRLTVSFQESTDE